MVPALSPHVQYRYSCTYKTSSFYKPAVPVQYSTGANDDDNDDDDDDDVRVVCPFLYGRPAPIVTIED